MASTTPHLLTLPREIRDNIYKHLRHRLDLRSIDKLGTVQVIVTLENAPCVDIMLVHSQMRDEYLQSDSFKNLSASILGLRVSESGIRWSVSDARANKDNMALLRVKNVTLRNALCSYDTKSPLEPIDVLLDKSLALHTIRMVQSRFIARHSEESLPKPINYGNLDSSSRLPQTLAGLSLRQHARGCRLDTIIDDELYRSKPYKIFQVKTYVFTSRLRVDAWTADEAIYYAAPRWIWDQLSEERRDRVRRRTVKMIDWAEEDLEA